MIKKFIHSLKRAPDRQGVFNPWWAVDPENDMNGRCPSIRRRQLHQYLAERLGRATYLLVGEALGYQGGHFTGIPMTSERMLLGGLAKKGILPQHAFSGIKAVRTSRPEIKPLGFSEPTGTIVWGHLAHLKGGHLAHLKDGHLAHLKDGHLAHLKGGRAGPSLGPEDVILWNAFPWHPYKPEKGLLSNRTPDAKELSTGEGILLDLVDLSKPEKIIAVGEKAFGLLNRLGVTCFKVRHPANGGAARFREQFMQVLG